MDKKTDKGDNMSKLTEEQNLLEACKSALTEWTLHGSLTDTAKNLRQAIAKAEALEKEKI